MAPSRDVPIVPAVIATHTSEPPIYVSMEFSDDYDMCGKGTWKWVAKRSWTSHGSTRTEMFEIPHDAEDAEKEDVISVIQALTRTPEGAGAKYVISRANEEPRYVAIRVD